MPKGRQILAHIMDDIISILLNTEVPITMLRTLIHYISFLTTNEVKILKDKET